MSVCLSAWKNPPPVRQTSRKFDIGLFFRKSIEEIQVPSESDKNNGYFTWIHKQFFLIISRWILLRIIMFQMYIVEKITTYYTFNIYFFFRKYVEEIQVPSESDKNNGYFTWIHMQFFLIISRWILLRVIMFQIYIVEKIKIHYTFNIFFFENMSKKFKLHLNLTRITCTLHEHICNSF